MNDERPWAVPGGACGVQGSQSVSNYLQARGEGGWESTPVDLFRGVPPLVGLVH